MCCQRAREQESSDKPREFRFQSRALPNGSYSTIKHSSNSFVSPTSASKVIAQKRKAESELSDIDFEDDPNAPQDLLSRLDRLTAEVDRAASITQPLVMPQRQRDAARMEEEQDDMATGATEPARPRLRAAELLGRARSRIGSDAGASNFRFGTGGQTSSASPFNEAADSTSTVTVNRPAQRRFLSNLDKPSWLGGSDASS